MRVVFLAATVLLAACSTAVTRESFVPVPEHPPRAGASPEARGSAHAASLISREDGAAIAAEIVRRMYRPMMAHARWIDPKPLAHQRSEATDSLVAADPDWALAIVEAANLRRVCPLTEANAQCRGLQGGILRFSAPYAVGTSADSAIMYVRYTPVQYGIEGELEFFVVRQGAAWRVVSRRTMALRPATLPASSSVVDPQQAVDELLAADRAFAAAASTGTASNLVKVLSDMFVSNVVMQAPGGHVRGRDAAIASLDADPDNRRSRVVWHPVRGGVASSGQDGFTLGYMTVTRPDGTVQPMKYVAYWVLRPGGWRVAAYKRVPRAAGDVSLAMMAPSLPVRALPAGDEAAVRRWADELSAAEHAFSRDAAPMGLGPAFEKWGAPDAVHTGGSSHVEFVRGPRAIAHAVSAGNPPDMTITWAPAEVIVATTGDLGVSIGTIRIGTPATAGQPAQTREVPFFTVWKRAYPTDPWRYVAE